MKLAVTATAVLTVTDVNALRLDKHAQKLARRRIARESNDKVFATHRKSKKLNPVENFHPNPFYKMDWWPQTPSPDDEAKANDPNEAEILAKEEADLEAMNAEGFSLNAAYEAEAAKKEAAADEFNEALKKKAAEEDEKAKKAEQDAKAIKKRAEETKKAALKALLEQLKVKLADLESFKSKELAKCGKDLSKARNQWNSDIRWYHNSRNQAARNFHNAVNRAPWWRRMWVWVTRLHRYHRRLHQINRQLRPKYRRWSRAVRKHRKCHLQQRTFDWEIAQARAKYDEARGNPDILEAGGGCFKDGGKNGGDGNQRAMIRIRGWFNHKRCARRCGERGFDYMSIQDGAECYCGRGDQHAKFGKAKDGECNMPCPDWDEREKGMKCGGPWRNSVYKIE